MTRAPVNPDANYWEYRWQWRCDTNGCGTVTTPVRRSELPSTDQMRAAGWIIANPWGDECPTCDKAAPVMTVTCGDDFVGIIILPKLTPDQDARPGWAEHLEARS